MPPIPPDVATTGFLQWLATLGVGGAIAGFMFLFYRRDSDAWRTELKAITERYIAAIEGQRDEERIRAGELLQVVKENTSAVTENTQVVKSMHRRLDALDGGGRHHQDPVDQDRRRPRG